MKAVDELKKEHGGIELMLRVLKAVSTKVERGEEVRPGDIDGIMEFLTVFVDKCHHGKEEDFLFPALEAAGVPRVGGPIGVLLDEHAQGRALVSKMGDSVTQQRSDREAPAAFAATSAEYATLLSNHIEKENNVLFVMAEDRLDSVKDDELFEAFEQLERERIGPNKHEEFHELLHRLEHEYLGG